MWDAFALKAPSSTTVSAVQYQSINVLPSLTPSGMAMLVCVTQATLSQDNSASVRDCQLIPRTVSDAIPSQAQPGTMESVSAIRDLPTLTDNVSLPLPPTKPLHAMLPPILTNNNLDACHAPAAVLAAHHATPVPLANQDFT